MINLSRKSVLKSKELISEVLIAAANQKEDNVIRKAYVRI